MQDNNTNSYMDNSENYSQSPIDGGIDKDAKMWAMFCHLAGLAGYIIPTLFMCIIAPLIMWQIKKEDNPFIDENGKEAVNFQISILIYTVACFPFVLVVIGIPMIMAVGIFNVICIIMAAMKANNGEHYRYPITIRFIS